MEDTSRLLFPFNEKYSRSEILLIQFENVLANTNYLIIKKMLLDYDNWIKKYPLLEEFKGRTTEEIFMAGCNLTKDNLLFFLSGNKLENTKDDYNKLDSIISFYDLDIQLNISLSLFKLAANSKISKVIITANSINEEKMRYITHCFGVNICNKKIYTLENSLEGIIKNFEDGEITTIFVHDIDSIYDSILKNDNINKDEKSFYIMESNVNYIIEDNEFKGFKYLENVKKMMKIKKFELNFYGNIHTDLSLDFK